MESASVTRLRRAGQAILLMVGLTLLPVSAPAETKPKAEAAMSAATYFAALSNLASVVMFSGLGENLIFSPYERDDWLRRAGFVTRPPMPDMAIVGALYAAGDPVFKMKPDFGDPATLAWRREGFDRTLDPSAQAWALIKITSPEFHLQFHETPDNKIAALMMIPQARVQARTLIDRLHTSKGFFAARRADGVFATPRPEDQAVVLWAAANLVLAATSRRPDYWHASYRQHVDKNDGVRLARMAFAALRALPPEMPEARAIAIAALGRYAAIEDDPTARKEARTWAAKIAVALRAAPGNTLTETGFAVYGLIEAGRLLGDRGLKDAAANLFRMRLLAHWDDGLGVFEPGSEIAYTPRRTGALIAALNAVRWYGPDDLKTVGEHLYARFVETILFGAGLLQASPLPLVDPAYREGRPDSEFAPGSLPDAAQAGVAPVFAAEVTWRDGAWSVTDSRFRTADALFLANMLAVRTGNRADPFLSEDVLSKLR